MPCHDAGASEQAATELRDKVHRLTRMLCGICQRSPRLDMIQVDGLSKWWDEHQAKDRSRESEERAAREKLMLIRKGMDKLSTEEARALGLL